jgi:tetratricopeptide (TPR) repeat protein
MIASIAALCCVLYTGNDINPADVQGLIQQGLRFAYVEAFDSAHVYFDEIITRYPENPAGYFFKASLLQLIMMDMCHFSHDKEYLSLMKQVRNKANAIISQRNDLWASFYLGSSYTYQAVYEGWQGNYFETFQIGVKGGRMLQDIIKQDSTFYDAYLGAGTYEYFWARAARYLPVLRLAGGNVGEALRKLHVAAQKSFYGGPTAYNSLAYIYGEEGMFSEADRYIDTLLQHYPEGRTFIWNKAKLEYKKGNFLEAKTYYQRLFNAYESIDKKNYSNLAQCKLFIGKCCYELGDKQNAKEAMKDVIGYKKFSDKYPKIKTYCREAYGVLSRIY